MNALILISIWLVAISQCVAISQHVALKIAPTGAKVVFQWPMAFCVIDECRDDIVQLPHSFRLHGVWPTYTPPPPHGSVDCDSVSNPYSWSAIKDLRNIDKWISYKSRNHSGFLEYQWNKHGSCFELNCAHYFQSSLRLWQQKYTDILTALKDNGIKPSPYSVYIIENFYYAIVNSLNLRSIIVCKIKNWRQYVVEIILCATHDLSTFRNCSGPPEHHMRSCGGRFSQAFFYRDPKKLDIKQRSSQIITSATT